MYLQDHRVAHTTLGPDRSYLSATDLEVLIDTYWKVRYIKGDLLRIGLQTIRCTGIGAERVILSWEQVFENCSAREKLVLDIAQEDQEAEAALSSARTVRSPRKANSPEGYPINNPAFDELCKKVVEGGRRL